MSPRVVALSQIRGAADDLRTNVCRVDIWLASTTANASWARRLNASGSPRVVALTLTHGAANVPMYPAAAGWARGCYNFGQKMEMVEAVSLFTDDWKFDTEIYPLSLLLFSVFIGVKVLSMVGLVRSLALNK